ncbi:hypothetical protein GCM10011450_25670 [Advenella faeciporci]|uniref:Uncharacterized protein n=1 Tax=Advenella faeciporci TaxID=797535 RepID=A0A918MZV2_9BURK|nr:hypothetical protein GCM10011450_25670 [Advenella faeciporci]
MIDATTALIIERDNGEGTPDKACKEGEDTSKCWPGNRQAGCQAVKPRVCR